MNSAIGKLAKVDVPLFAMLIVCISGIFIASAIHDMMGDNIHWGVTFGIGILLFGTSAILIINAPKINLLAVFLLSIILIGFGVYSMI